MKKISFLMVSLCAAVLFIGCHQDSTGTRSQQNLNSELAYGAWIPLTKEGDQISYEDKGAKIEHLFRIQPHLLVVKTTCTFGKQKSLETQINIPIKQITDNMIILEIDKKRLQENIISHQAEDAEHICLALDFPDLYTGPNDIELKIPYMTQGDTITLQVPGHGEHSFKRMVK